MKGMVIDKSVNIAVIKPKIFEKIYEISSI
jgi:hypothetical protein